MKLKNKVKYDYDKMLNYENNRSKTRTIKNV